MSEVVYILQVSGLLGPIQALITGLAVISLILFLLKRT